MTAWVDFVRRGIYLSPRRGETLQMRGDVFGWGTRRLGGAADEMPVIRIVRDNRSKNMALTMRKQLGRDESQTLSRLRAQEDWMPTAASHRTKAAADREEIEGCASARQGRCSVILRRGKIERLGLVSVTLPEYTE